MTVPQQVSSTPGMATASATPTVACTVYDAAEGRLHVTVRARDDDEAHEEAGIAAAERGCRAVTEIVVGVHE